MRSERSSSIRAAYSPVRYELALDRLGVPAHRVLLTDDAEPNVLGARMVGLRALLHLDRPPIRAALAEPAPDLHSHITGATA